MTETGGARCSERLYENAGFPELIDLVEANEHVVLDIGCGAGANMRLLRARGHETVGVTISEVEAERCRESGLVCIVADVTTRDLPVVPGSVDAVILSHVLEHLVRPEEVLAYVNALLRPGGAVYVALPNPLYILQRWEFLRGRFRYTETGLMDSTHVRFFDFASARALVESAGFTVTVHRALGHVPLRPVRRIAPALCGMVDRTAADRMPGLFGFHILVKGVTPEQH